MKHAKYIGGDPRIRNCGALVRPDPRSRRHVLVQFDRVWDGHGMKVYRFAELCCGWHRFRRSEFRMDRARSHSHWRKVRSEYVRRYGPQPDGLTIEKLKLAKEYLDAHDKAAQDAMIYGVGAVRETDGGIEHVPLGELGDFWLDEHP